MSEFIGSDETLFSLWPENFSNRPQPLDWLPKDQQVTTVPIILLEDGRVAYQSDDGNLCVLGEDYQPMTTLEDLPTLSDATIKSMLVDPPMLSLSVADMPELSSTAAKDLPPPSPSPSSPIDEEFKPLVCFRCQYCPFSSPDVHSLMEHSNEHPQPEILNEQSSESGHQSPKTETSLPTAMEEEEEESEQVCGITEQFVYICSECNSGFISVEECRDHMIKDHDMVFDMEDEPVDVVGVVSERVSPPPLIPSVPPSPSPSPPPPPPTPPPRTPTPPPPPTSPPPPPPPPPPIITKPPRPKPPPREYDPEFEVQPHKCPEAFCAHKFQTLSNLEIHIECHSTSTQSAARFSCPHCSFSFQKWGQCAVHLWKDHQIDIDLYSCNVCKEYKTTTRRKLESHAKTHSDARPHTCDICNKGFKQRSQLVNHATSVHHKNKNNNLPQPKWYMAQKCEICHKTYADSKCLKKHMQAVHSKLKPYKCNICGHMSARKAMMQSHARQHTGEKPFACSHCSFKTGDHNSLRRHVMRHTGVKPYKCPHCSYSCIQSSSFKQHLQTRHPGQSGAFTCAQCYFTTVNRENYEQHMSDHNLNLIPLPAADAEVFPENVAAAQLVYRSLGASPSRLHHELTGSRTSRDRMKQTITISIPSNDATVSDDDDDTTHCFLRDSDETEEIDTGGITIPAEPEEDQPLICFNYMPDT